MTHIARGVDDQGVLQIDVIISGEVPVLPDQASVRVMPYVEDYIQTGPGELLAELHHQYQVRFLSIVSVYMSNPMKEDVVYQGISSHGVDLVCKMSMVQHDRLAYILPMSTSNTTLIDHL